MESKDFFNRRVEALDITIIDKDPKGRSQISQDIFKETIIEIL